MSKEKTTETMGCPHGYADWKACCHCIQASGGAEVNSMDIEWRSMISKVNALYIRDTFYGAAIESPFGWIWVNDHCVSGPFIDRESAMKDLKFYCEKWIRIGFPSPPHGPK